MCGLVASRTFAENSHEVGPTGKDIDQSLSILILLDGVIADLEQPSLGIVGRCSDWMPGWPAIFWRIRSLAMPSGAFPHAETEEHCEKGYQAAGRMVDGGAAGCDFSSVPVEQIVSGVATRGRSNRKKEPILRLKQPKALSAGRGHPLDVAWRSLATIEPMVAHQSRCSRCCDHSPIFSQLGPLLVVII